MSFMSSIESDSSQPLFNQPYSSYPSYHQMSGPARLSTTQAQAAAYSTPNISTLPLRQPMDLSRYFGNDNKMFSTPRSQFLPVSNDRYQQPSSSPPPLAAPLAQAPAQPTDTSSRYGTPQSLPRSHLSPPTSVRYHPSVSLDYTPEKHLYPWSIGRTPAPMADMGDFEGNGEDTQNYTTPLMNTSSLPFQPYHSVPEMKEAAGYSYAQPQMQMGGGYDGDWRLIPQPGLYSQVDQPDATSIRGRRHVCPVCDKRFNRPSSLNTHMAVHTGARPYQCSKPDCGRRFSVSSNLRRHERTHETNRRAKSISGLSGHSPSSSVDILSDSTSRPHGPMHAHSFSTPGGYPYPQSTTSSSTGTTYSMATATATPSTVGSGYAAYVYHDQQHQPYGPMPPMDLGAGSSSSRSLIQSPGTAGGSLGSAMSAGLGLDQYHLTRPRGGRATEGEGAEPRSPLLGYGESKEASVVLH